MNIFAHRGCWSKKSDQNTLTALRYATECGFGVETDIRDRNGQLVISHDMSTENSVQLAVFLDELPTHYQNSLALNIKADGLADEICNLMDSYSHINYFCFDMSIPDKRDYLKKSLPVYARISDVESEAPWLQRCLGIWLDAFDIDWFDLETIEAMLKSNKVVVVSPELHKRNFEPIWELLLPISSHPGISICTDFPAEADLYFN